MLIMALSRPRYAGLAQKSAFSQLQRSFTASTIFLSICAQHPANLCTPRKYKGLKDALAQRMDPED